MKRSFRAMGTEITVLTDEDVDGATFSAALSTVTAIFEREEARFSRFREDSELTRVNRAAGGWIDVSTPFAEVLRRAVAGASATGGLFDPTVLDAVVTAGYDRDFLSIEDPGFARPLRSVACGGWRDIVVRDGRVRLPRGVGIDLGGLVKGWTADLAAEAAVAAGLPWAVVNAGGDLRLAGGAAGIVIGIEEPLDPTQVCCTVRLDGGALATTSVTQRRWGPALHHLIDPRDGLPARTPSVQATVWASTCADAEIQSKRALLQGTPVLADLTGILILATGEVVTNLTTVQAA
jgi:thiamine biosynthesis lipoprotein